MKDALKKAIELTGSQKALADEIGVSQPRVNNWLNRDDKVPAEFVHPICEATKNKVKPYELRPDVFKSTNTV